MFGSEEVESEETVPIVLRLSNDICNTFNGLDMTDPNDKLVAISGLAKYFASKSMGALGQYAAGLWETQLES
jgi:hypothetical protein